MATTPHIGKDKHLRNRANDNDRPLHPKQLRQVALVKPESQALDRCKEGEGHTHIFQRFDRYGCCTRCGDEVLT